jgi:hypothetical protein
MFVILVALSIVKFNEINYLKLIAFILFVAICKDAIDLIFNIVNMTIEKYLTNKNK